MFNNSSLFKRMLLSLAVIMLGIGIVVPSYYYGYKFYYNNKPVPEVYKFKSSEAIFIRGTMVNSEAATKASRRGREGIDFTDMDLQAERLIRLVRKGVTNITIDIDSGGGMLDGGDRFIDQLKDAQARGIKVTCVVTGRAMSMALITFSECDTRYALFGTRLLWHSVLFGYMGYLNQNKLVKMLLHVTDMNFDAWANTRKYFYPGYFLTHFENESKLTASELEREGFGYLRVIQNVEIVD